MAKRKLIIAKIPADQVSDTMIKIAGKILAGGFKTQIGIDADNEEKIITCYNPDTDTCYTIFIAMNLHGNEVKRTVIDILNAKTN